MENRQGRQTPPAQTNGGNGSRGINRQQELTAYCLRLLALRPYSRQEIQHRLKRRTSDEALINTVLSWLEQQQLIDDAKFAAWLVESYSRSRPKGKILLLRQLRQKGVDPGVADSAVSALPDEVGLAGHLLAKKATSWKHLNDREFRQKAGRFLYSRGFTWNTIEQAVKKRYN